MATSAGKDGSDYLVTRDRKGFERSQVPTISPADSLRQIREAESVLYGAVDIEPLQDELEEGASLSKSAAS